MRSFVLIVSSVATLMTAAVATAAPGVSAPQGGATPPAYGGCADDAYEPDSFASPRPLAPGRLDGLAVCGGNDDHWQIEAEPGMLLHIRVEFSHAAGDVDMTLHRAGDTAEVDISDGVTNFEELFYTAERAETLILRVYGYAGASNRYSLILGVDDYSAGCVGDPLEPNNLASAAVVPAPMGAARVCLGDEDWYFIDVRPGEGFDFGVDFNPRMADLAVGLYRPDDPGTPIRVARAHAHSAMVAVDESVEGGRYLVRVWPAAGGFNSYSYSVARYPAGGGISGVIRGTVEYEDELRGRDVVIGAPWMRWLPARDVPVELVRVADGRVIATSYTNESGSYDLPFRHRAEGEARVRVAARLEELTFEMQVIEHEESRVLQAGESAPLSVLQRDNGGIYRVDFRFAADGPLGGAFNIVDRALDAFRFVEGFRPLPGLELTVVWQRGRPHDCASCFDEDTIYLGGGFDDPDEYDDSVILHELGHFFIHTMSHDDSPGGNHNGDRTDALIAYGEGIATIFAMMVEGSYIYVDTMTAGGLLQDFERANYPEARGTSTGTITGQISEYLIVGLIWDLLDDGDEPHDSLSAGDEAVMNVLFDYMPDASSRNRGVAGADLADFIEGFRTLYPGHSGELDRLLEYYQFPGGNLAATRPGPGGK